MSGLDNFFAKKDRKKKKSSSRTTIAPPIETKPAEVTPEEPLPKVAPPPPKPVDVDDGWIEIDDPRGSQVNTGGRTIVEFRRYVHRFDFKSADDMSSYRFLKVCKFLTVRAHPVLLV